MEGATQALAEFAATTKLADVPRAAVEAAKIIILDTFGCMLAGAGDTACKVLSQWVKEQEAPPRATVIGQGFRSSQVLAALANGHAAHALDLDDSGHYSTHTLPAALAVGEQARIPGAKLLKAYILGREVCCRLDAAFDATRREGRGPTYRGWHHTGTNGSLAAAVSTGVVLDLNTKQMQNAIGIAANGAGGLRANMGTMAKALISGNAARNGVMAGTLARSGFSAEENVLETPQGVAEAFCFEDEINWQALIRDLGKRYELEEGSETKDYACCSPAHRPIEAVLKIVRDHGVRAGEVDRIACDPHSFSLRRHEPRDAQGGQYSLEYCLSVALLDGKVGLEQMTDERVRAADVQGLMRHLKFVPPESGPASRTAKERLKVYLRDGRSYSAEIEHPRRITTREGIEAKFFNCAARAVAREKAAALRDTMLKLEDLPDITKLMDYARGG